MSDNAHRKLGEAEVQKAQKDFLSIDLAYNIAVNSYDALVKRVDSIDGRLQTMLALFASVTATIPVIGAQRGLSFHSDWFQLAIAAMVAATIVTAIARLGGKVELLDPNKLNTNEWLRCSEWEFKNLVIQYAGQAFTANKRLVSRKWLCTILVTITFFLGAVCLALWAGRI